MSNFVMVYRGQIEGWKKYVVVGLVMSHLYPNKVCAYCQDREGCFLYELDLETKNAYFTGIPSPTLAARLVRCFREGSLTYRRKTYEKVPTRIARRYLGQKYNHAAIVSPNQLHHLWFQ